MSKQIAITRGHVAIVDDDVSKDVSDHKWFYQNGYAARSVAINGKRKILYMHRAITAAGDGFEVDHINRDKLDNRRINLRVCTKEQNRQHSSIRATNKSGYRGVYFSSSTHKWVAQIRVNGKSTSLGLFTSARDAALVRDRAVRSMFGEFADLNFPDAA